MATQKDNTFFDEYKEWSEQKHQLLTQYLAPAAKILGSTHRVWYVDGFAGRGTYGDGANMTYGSPVKAAEIAQEYAQKGKHYAFRCINIEENPEWCENLKEATAHFGDLVLNLCGTFERNLDRIMQEVGNDAVICFLDPFGVKGIDMVALETIMARRRPVDFWIRFDPRTVRRLDAFFASLDARGISKFARLFRSYGITDKEYLHEQLDGPTVEARIENALKLYVTRFAETFAEKRGSGVGYVATYPIRTNERKHKYDMVFGTGNAKGAVLASDVVYTVEETYEKAAQELAERRHLERTQQYKFNLDPTEQEVFEDKVERLHEDIWTACRGMRITRLGIRSGGVIWKKWFGKVKATHFTHALHRLDKEGRIDRAQTKGAFSSDDTYIKFVP